MANQLQENPFAFHGGVAVGEHFVGRAREIDIARQRCLTKRPGSLAIIGMPRVGKSSLANRVFIEPQAELAQQLAILTSWTQVSVKQKPADIFKSVARGLAATAKKASPNINRGSAVHLVERSAEEVLKAREWDELDEGMANFLLALRDAEFTGIAVLDEFDHSRTAFEGAPEAFHLLREVANNPTCGIGLVTVSRRPVVEIEEVACPGNSNLDGIFLDLQVPCFNDAEIRSLLAPFDEIQVPRGELDEKLAYYCGNQPYLAAEFAFRTSQQWLSERRLNLGAVIEAAEPKIYREYDHVLALLQDRKLKDCLLGALFGPKIHARPTDVSQLRQYGILQSDPTSNGYRTFSAHFQAHLEGIRREVDLWPLWTETEQRLRRALDEVLTRVHGTADWGGAARGRQQLSVLVPQLETRRSDYIRRNAAANESSLINYADPSHYMAFVSAYWTDLKPVLGDDKQRWDERFRLLSRVRNPLAHSNESFVSIEDRVNAEATCHTILARITQWGRDEARSAGSK